MFSRVNQLDPAHQKEEIVSLRIQAQALHSKTDLDVAQRILKTRFINVVKSHENSLPRTRGWEKWRASPSRQVFAVLAPYVSDATFNLSKSEASYGNQSIVDAHERQGVVATSPEARKARSFLTVS
jgi:hypothetical protein